MLKDGEEEHVRNDVSRRDAGTPGLGSTRSRSSLRLRVSARVDLATGRRPTDAGIRTNGPEKSGWPKETQKAKKGILAILFLLPGSTYFMIVTHREAP